MGPSGWHARPVLRYHSAVVDEIDIYRSAALQIEKHGEDAVIEAAIRADAMLDKGDLDGQRRGCSSLGGGTVIRFPRIWMSYGECRLSNRYLAGRKGIGSRAMPA